MLIGASNISWDREENPMVFNMLREAGFDYIESVYYKISDGYPIKAVQSLFYNSGISSLDNTKKAVAYIKELINYCEEIGVQAITFGSPNMRVGSKDKMHAFLSEVDEILEGKSVKFCIEPNAKYYGAEYYNTLEEISKDLLLYNNICSMIDVGNSLLEDKNPIEEYREYSQYVSHIHFAAKDLKAIENYHIYKDFYEYLLENGYNGLVTYEFGTIDNIKNNLNNFITNIK